MKKNFLKEEILGTLVFLISLFLLNHLLKQMAVGIFVALISVAAVTVVISVLLDLQGNLARSQTFNMNVLAVVSLAAILASEYVIIFLILGISMILFTIISYKDIIKLCKDYSLFPVIMAGQYAIVIAIAYFMFLYL